jgi:sarcosine oxidase
LWDDLGASHYDPRGFICVSREPGDESELYLEGMRAGGYAHEMFTPAEAAARWPFLTEEAIRFVFHSAEGGALHCRRIAKGIADWLRATGRRHAPERPRGGRRRRGRTRASCRRRGDRSRPHRRDRRRLGPETLSSGHRHALYLPHRRRLSGAASRPEGGLGDRADHPGRRRRDEWLHHPAFGRGGAEIRLGPHKRPTDDADADRVPRPGEGEALRDLFAAPIARVGDYAVREFVTCAYTFTADETFHCEGAASA